MNATDATKPPRATDWNTDGIGITEDGLLIIRCDDATNITWSREGIAGAHARILQLEDECEDARNQLKYSRPTLFTPDMILALEARADECDKQKWVGQAMAYRDAAGMMRKALRNEP